MKNPDSKTQQEQQDPATHTGHALLQAGAKGQPLSTEHSRGWGPCADRGQAKQQDSPGLSATSPEALILKERRAWKIYYPQRALGGSEEGVSFLPSCKNQRIC